MRGSKMALVRPTRPLLAGFPPLLVRSRAQWYRLPVVLGKSPFRLGVCAAVVFAAHVSSGCGNGGSGVHAAQCPGGCPATYVFISLVLTASPAGGPVAGAQVAFSGPASGVMSCLPEDASTLCLWPSGPVVAGEYLLDLTAPGFPPIQVRATLTVTPDPLCGCTSAQLNPSSLTLERPDTAVCTQLASAAQAQFESYFQSTYSQTCQVDSDCSILEPRSLGCFAFCSKIIARTADVAAITQATTGACDQYHAAGCLETIPPCMQACAACAGGTCVVVAGACGGTGPVDAALDAGTVEGPSDAADDAEAGPTDAATSCGIYLDDRVFDVGAVFSDGCGCCICSGAGGICYGGNSCTRLVDGGWESFMSLPPCHSDDDCSTRIGAGAVCVFDQGCLPGQGRCANRPSTSCSTSTYTDEIAHEYCGCDGNTFQVGVAGAKDYPDRPYAHLGACP